MPDLLPRSPKGAGEPYLRLQLQQNLPALLPMQFAQEVLITPAAKVTVMPGMPASVLGLINRRSRVFWLVDLAALVGLAPLPLHLLQYSVVLMRTGQAAFALAVEDIRGVVRLLPDVELSESAPINPRLAAYATQTVGPFPDTLPILDATAIAAAVAGQPHPV